MSHDQRRDADRGTRSTKLGRFRRACLGVGAYIVGIVASASLVGTLSAPTAQAASDVDDVVTVVPNLILNNQGAGDPTIDVSLDWYTEALESSLAMCNFGNSDSCTVNQDLQNLLLNPNANWAVSVQNGGSNFLISYSFDSNANLQFIGDKLVLISNDARSTNGFSFWPDHPWPKTQSGIVYGGGIVDSGDIIVAGDSPAYSNTQIFLSTFPVVYPPGYEGEIIPGDVDPDPLYQEPWNLPAAETADCDWWNLTCFMGTVDFNPIRDVTQQASENLGFIAQFGEVIGELTEMMTAMPDFFAGVDPCWTTGQSGYCTIPVNIFGQESSISLHHIRTSPVMLAVMPWLLYAMMGLMAWNLFKSLPELIEDITKA